MLFRFVCVHAFARQIGFARPPSWIGLDRFAKCFFEGRIESKSLSAEMVDKLGDWKKSIAYRASFIEPRVIGCCNVKRGLHSKEPCMRAFSHSVNPVCILGVMFY